MICMKRFNGTRWIETTLVMSIVLLFYSGLPAQEPPMEWGRVSREDLEMKSFPEDSSASAIVLCDYGKAWFTGDLDLIFERHTRIKILSESGYSLGHVTIPYHSNKKIQDVKDIQGQTFYLSEAGKEKRRKLSKKSIHKKNIDKEHVAVGFTLPELQPGCVIEYRYKIISKHPKYLPDWYFQSHAPVRWSEYRIRIPENFEYLTIFPSGQEMHINESKPFQQRIAIKYQPKDAGTGLYTGTSPGKAIFEINGLEHRMVMKNVPAIREHPFITTLDDYRIKLEIQLKAIYHFGFSSRWSSEVSELQPHLRKTAEASDRINVLTTWRDVAKRLMDSKNFGSQIQEHEIFHQQAESITADTTTSEQKIEAISKYLMSRMQWTGQYSIYTDQELDRAFDSGRASNAEIALILLSMLRNVGLDAHPVLISTRNHGMIRKEFPTEDQFNDVLVHVNTSEGDYLLDVRDPIRPFTLLPVEALKEEGWMVDEYNPRWIRIIAPGKYEHQITINARLQDDNSIRATLRSEDGEYSALEKRHELGENGGKHFIHNNLLRDFADVRVDSFSIINQDSPEENLVTKVTFSASDFAQSIGDSIVLNPIFIDRFDENPFSSPQRGYPVDFAYPQDISYTLDLRIPQGLVIAKHPENFILTLPRDSGTFSRMLQIDGNVFHLTSRIKINKARFRVAEYEELREFYDRVVEAHSEKIVLLKGLR